MKNLWFLSLLGLLIAGCVSVKPSGIVRDRSNVTHHTPQVTSFLSPGSSHLFKATLDIKKHHLTGLLVIKRMDTIVPSQTMKGNSDGTYRIVFVNEIGMTFFDLELKPDSFKVVSCFESLDKKALMKIFETDFRVMTRNGVLKNALAYRQEGTNNTIITGKDGKYQTWQTYSPAGDTLYVKAAKSNLADPVIISFDQYANGFPGKIILENPFIGMKLSLRRLAK